MSENMMPPEGDFEDDVYDYEWVHISEGNGWKIAQMIGAGWAVEDRVGDQSLMVREKVLDTAGTVL